MNKEEFQKRKEIANIAYRSGDFKKAISLYTEIVRELQDLFKKVNEESDDKTKIVTSCDSMITILSNRSMSYKKLGLFFSSLIDLRTIFLYFETRYSGNRRPFFKICETGNEKKYIKSLFRFSDILKKIGNGEMFFETKHHLRVLLESICLREDLPQNEKLYFDDIKKRVIKECKQEFSIHNNHHQYLSTMPRVSEENFDPRLHFIGRWVKIEVRNELNLPLVSHNTISVIGNRIFLFFGKSSRIPNREFEEEINQFHQKENKFISKESKKSVFNESDVEKAFDFAQDQFIENQKLRKYKYNKNIQVIEYTTKKRNNDQFEAYDIDLSSSTSEESPRFRTDHSCTSIFQKSKKEAHVYVFGGLLELTLTEYMTRKQPLPKSRDPQYNRKELFWRFDAIKEKWERLAPPPSRIRWRIDHAAVSWRNRFIIFFGGYSIPCRSPERINDDDNECVMNIDVYDTKTQKWFVLWKPPKELLSNKRLLSCKMGHLFPCVRGNPFLFIQKDDGGDDEYLYVYGGSFRRDCYFVPKSNRPEEDYLNITASDQSSTTLDDLWKLNLRTKEWEEVLLIGNIPSSRQEIGGVQTKNGKYIIFGGFSCRFMQKRSCSYIWDTFELDPNSKMDRDVTGYSNELFPQAASFRMKVEKVELKTKKNKKDKKKKWIYFPYGKDDIKSGICDPTLFMMNKKIYMYGGYSMSGEAGEFLRRGLYRLDVDEDYSINVRMCCKCFRNRKCRGAGFCGRCKKVFYCSRKCQTDDWKNHKKKCL